MEVFVARQPILDLDGNVYGYELLYRNSSENSFVSMDGNQATSEVLKNSFFTIGLERLAENKPCFINFTEDLLLESVPEYFNPNQLIIEILENVSFTQGLLEVCRELKGKGFRIALDDVIGVEKSLMDAILNEVDIVKVDIQAATNEGRTDIVQLAAKKGVILLAEKVETKMEYEHCIREGFHLFQGYYFSKPAVIKGVDIPFFESTYLDIMGELSVPADEINIDKVSELLGQDLSLTYKLLRLINTSLDDHPSPVYSIKQAVLLLGPEILKKWLYVLSIEQTKATTAQTPQLVTKSSLLRAKMCEQLAIRLRMDGKADGYFLTGFMSLVDGIIKQPMEEVVRTLPLNREIQEALLGHSNRYHNILVIVMAMEQADFEHLDLYLEKYDLSFNEIFEIYGQAIAWTEHLYQEHFTN